MGSSLILYSLLLVANIANIRLTSADFGFSVIRSFIEAKKVFNVVLITCNTSKTADVNLQKEFSNYYTTIFDGFENITMINNELKTHLSLVVMESCELQLERLFQNWNKVRRLFDSRRHWLVLIKNTSSLFFFNHANLSLNCDVNVALLRNDEDFATIYDVYNPSYVKNGTLRVTEIGNITDSIYPGIFEAKYWRRRDLSELTFVTSVVMPSNMKTLTRYQYLETDLFREIRSFDRFHYNILKHCRDFYNFTMDVRTIDSWGYLQPDGTIDGMVNLLNNSLIDFGGSPLFSKYERLNIIDYSASTWILRSTFMYRRPKVNAPPLEVFIRPLSMEVWFCVAATAAAVVILTRYVLVYEKRNVHFLRQQESNWVYAALMNIGVMCQQGTFHTPFFHSGRLLTGTFLIFAILLSQFYSGYILSYILMDPPRMINNLFDLLHSTLKAGCEDVLYDRDYFAITTDPVAKELYREKIRNDTGFFTPENGLALVKEGGFAYHVVTSTAYVIIRETFDAESICELEEVQMYRIQIMYTNLPKHSPFKQMFDHVVRRMHENGSMKRMRRYWDSSKPICIKQADKITAVGLQEFSCALILLSFGTASSLILLFLEVLWHKKSMKQIIKPYVH